MRAAVFDRYGPAEVVRIEERPVPEAGDGEVLVRVDASANRVATVQPVSGRGPSPPRASVIDPARSRTVRSSSRVSASTSRRCR